MQKKCIFILIVWLTLIAAGCSGTALLSTASPTPMATRTSEVVFKTPEEAITYYFTGVVQNDSRKILQACAINEMAEKFKLDLNTERLGNILMPTTSLAPTDYPLYVETNKMQ